MTFKDSWPYSDWRDFTNKVARPLVEHEGIYAQQAALMRKFLEAVSADPYYLAVSLVIAENTVRRLEGSE